MDFSPMEIPVLQEALKRYITFLSSCLQNPENENQLVFIRGELEIAKDLLARLK